MKRLKKTLQNGGTTAQRLEESPSDQESRGTEAGDTAQRIGPQANDCRRVNFLQRVSWELCFHSMSLL